MITFICAVSFWSIRAIISSIVSRTSSLIVEPSLSASLTRVETAFSTFGRGALRPRLETLFQKRRKLVRFACLESLRQRLVVRLQPP